MSTETLEQFFSSAGISEEDIVMYSERFRAQNIDVNVIPLLNKNEFHQLNVKLGDIKRIEKFLAGQNKKDVEKEEATVTGSSKDKESQNKTELERRIQQLEERVWELELESSVINIGEAASNLLSKKEKPKSAIHSPSHSTSFSPSSPSSRSPKSAASSGSDFKPLPPLQPDLQVALEKLHDVRHSSAHAMKRHGDVGDDEFLKEKVKKLFDAESYFKKHEKKEVIYKYIPEEDLKLLKKNDQNF